MKFKHYILTRFNLGLYSQNPYNIPDVHEWMVHRLILFDNITLPSIQAQTCQDFTWVLAFDELTPISVISEFDCLERVKIIYEQPHIWLRKQKIETDWLITSRFDNDDYYLPEFVETIQGEFSERLEIIDIKYMQKKINNDRLFDTRRRRCNSPFISLVEPWMEVKTAMDKKHTVMPDSYPSRKIDKVLAYMIIHEMNVINKIDIKV